MNKTKTALCCSALLTAALAWGQNPPAGYTTAFADEFDSFNSSVWTCEEGYQRNNEAQNYTKDNVYATGGNLVLKATKRNEVLWLPRPDWGPSEAQECWYNSGSVWMAKQGFGYGIYEVRAKIPTGLGYWPAIWTTGDAYEWPYNGEIDIMEYYPSTTGNHPHSIHANVAYGAETERWKASWNSNEQAVDDASFGSQYHIWKMEYTDDYIKLYCDDQMLNYTMLNNTVNKRADWFPYDNLNPYRDPNNKQQIRLNLALGGNLGGSLANTTFPAEYLIDYVRVYTPDGTEFDVPSGYSYAGKDGNLIANGSFEDPGFTTEVTKVWSEETQSEPSYTIVKGHLPYWKVAQDPYNVRASIETESGRGNYLKLERDAYHAWGDGTVTYHVKGLTPGKTYTLSSLIKTTGSATHGFRIYQCDDKGYKTYSIISDLVAPDNGSWTTYSQSFKATSKNIAIEIYIANPWNNNKGNSAASFMVDDVTLTDGNGGTTVDPTPGGDVSVDIVNPSFDDNGSYTTRANYVISDFNGWGMALSDGSTLEGASWHAVAAQLLDEGDRKFLRMERFAHAGENGWSVTLKATSTPVSVTPGKEYTLTFDSRCTIDGDWNTWNNDAQSWMAAGVSVEGTTGTDGHTELLTQGLGAEWATHPIKFTPSGNTITIVCSVRKIWGDAVSGYCDFDNFKLTTEGDTPVQPEPEILPVLYFHGQLTNGWKLMPAYLMSETDGIYTVSMPLLYGNFKLTTEELAAGEHQYATQNYSMAYGTEYSCPQSTEAGKDMAMADFGLNCTVTFDYNKKTIKIDGQRVGDLKINGVTAAKNDNGVYTWTLDKLESAFTITNDAGLTFTTSNSSMGNKTEYACWTGSAAMKTAEKLKDVTVTFDLFNKTLKVEGTIDSGGVIEQPSAENMLVNPSFDIYDGVGTLGYAPYGPDSNPTWYKFGSANSLPGWTMPKFDEWAGAWYWGVQPGVMKRADGTSFLRLWRHHDANSNNGWQVGNDDDTYHFFVEQEISGLTPHKEYFICFDVRHNAASSSEVENAGYARSAAEPYQGHGIKIIDADGTELIHEVAPGGQVTLVDYNGNEKAAVEDGDGWQNVKIMFNAKSPTAKVRLYMYNPSMKQNWMTFADFDHGEFYENPVQTGISNVSAEGEGAETVIAVYNLTGVRVADSLSNLPSGIYIVRTTKGTYKKVIE